MVCVAHGCTVSSMSVLGLARGLKEGFWLLRYFSIPFQRGPQRWCHLLSEYSSTVQCSKYRFSIQENGPLSNRSKQMLPKFAQLQNGAAGGGGL